MSNYYYLDVSLILSEKSDSILPVFIKGSIEQSLKKVFGEIGGQLLTLDILKFDNKRNRLILRVHDRDFIKIRIALTLISQYQGIPCHYRIYSVSPSLPSLIGTHHNF